MAFGQPFTNALHNAVKGALCTVISTVDLVADASPFSRLPGGVAADAARAIITNAVCNTPPPPPVPPPFNGGQCDCQRYTVQIFADSKYGPKYRPLTVFSVWGPVSGVSYTAAEDESSGLITLKCKGASDTVCGSASEVTVVTSGDLENVVIGQLTSPDGPDNCGSLPSERPKPTADNTNVDVNVEFTNDLGVNVTTPVNISFAVPIVNIKGEVNFPISLTFAPNISFGGTINQNGDVNIGWGDPRTPDSPGDRNPNRGPCSDPGDPIETPPPPPSEIEPPPEEPEEPETEDVIIGVAVTVIAVGPNKATQIFQSDNPDIFAPNLGFVSFFCRVGGMSGFWTTDIPVKNRRQVIPCPWPSGAIRVAGTPQKGIQWTLTPIRSQQAEPVRFYAPSS